MKKLINSICILLVLVLIVVQTYTYIRAADWSEGDFIVSGCDKNVPVSLQKDVITLFEGSKKNIVINSRSGARVLSQEWSVMDDVADVDLFGTNNATIYGKRDGVTKIMVTEECENEGWMRFKFRTSSVRQAYVLPVELKIASDETKFYTGIEYQLSCMYMPASRWTEDGVEYTSNGKVIKIPESVFSEKEYEELWNAALSDIVRFDTVWYSKDEAIRVSNDGKVYSDKEGTFEIYAETPSTSILAVFNITFNKG